MGPNPSTCSGWIKVLSIIIAVGLVRAGGHFFRLMLLGLLGLAGLWMMHKLAQDFTKIRKGFQVAQKILRGKRAIADEHFEFDDLSRLLKNQTSLEKLLSKWSWETVLRYDPKHCVASFVCQSAAVAKSDQVNPEEITILKILHIFKHHNNWANNQLQRAVQIGFSSRDENICRKKFHTCPYSAKLMLSLVQSF